MNESHSTSAIVKTLIDKGFLFTYEIEVGRLNTSGESHFELIKPLSMPQQDAYNQILMQMMKKNVVLLHGVTSSGKTEVYIHLIKQALDEHRQVLYLLPEIALTVQIMERLHRVLETDLASITQNIAMQNVWKSGRNRCLIILMMSFWEPEVQSSCLFKNLDL